MKLLCKLFSHKMYSITWEANTSDFTVLCIRCEKRWEKHSRLGIVNE
jgi:hypothetical protein